MNHAGLLSLRHLRRTARQIIWGCLLLSLLLCLGALAGCLLGRPALADWQTMECLTALGMLATVLSTGCLSGSRHPRWHQWRTALRRASLVLAVLPLIIGGWILGHRLAGAAASGQGPWGLLPSPATGLSLLLYGVVLFQAGRRRASAWLGISLGLAWLLAWLSLLNLIYSVQLAQPNVLFGEVSLPAAGVMLMVCTGLTLLRPGQAGIRLLASPGPAGKQVRRLLPMVMVLTLAFGFFCLWALQRWGFSSGFGLAFYAAFTTVILVLLILYHAHTIARLDRQRKRTERQLTRRHAESERRSDYKAATMELERISQRLQLATLTAEIGIWDWDLLQNVLFWDDLMHQIYQVPHAGEKVAYQTWEDRLHPDDRAGAVTAMKEALDGVRDFNIVFRILWPDRTVHYIQAKAIVQRDETGRPLRMLGTNADITQKVMSEAGLQESEERFRHAFEYSAIGLALVDPHGIWLSMNKALCDIVGYAEHELLGRSFRDITHPDDLHEDQDNINRLIRGEVTHYQMEKRYFRKDGSIVWVMLTSSLVREAAGSPAYFISQVEDITQRHEAERVLNNQQKQLRMLIEHTPASVAMFDLNMCYVAASRRWREDYHLQSQPLLGRSHYEVFPEVGEEWKAIHRRALAGAVESRDEDRFLRADGQEEWLRWEVRPWREVDGEIGGVVMFTEVITERKQDAESVRASLEEKEVLLREIHHRVKNNMQIISSLLQLQTSALHDPADVAIFQDCQARIHAMAMVHDRLYRSGNLSTINFGEHLRELASLTVRGQTGSMGHIRLDVQCDDVELDLDKAIPLGLIATELLTNAFKHAFKDRDEGCISVLLQKKETKRMFLRVSDDGRGLPPKLDPASSRTLGLRLVRSLSHQIRAQILFPQDLAGCCIEITFDV